MLKHCLNRSEQCICWGLFSDQILCTNDYLGHHGNGVAHYLFILRRVHFVALLAATSSY